MNNQNKKINKYLKNNIYSNLLIYQKNIKKFIFETFGFVILKLNINANDDLLTKTIKKKFPIVYLKSSDKYLSFILVYHEKHKNQLIKLMDIDYNELIKDYKNNKDINLKKYFYKNYLINSKIRKNTIISLFEILLKLNNYQKINNFIKATIKNKIEN